jgi:hypothetical protein
MSGLILARFYSQSHALLPSCMHLGMISFLQCRWHYEMAQINAFARTVIRLLFGPSLMQGSYRQALIHFRTAAELCPIRVIHKVEVGRTLLKVIKICILACMNVYQFSQISQRASEFHRMGQILTNLILLTAWRYTRSY